MSGPRLHATVDWSDATSKPASPAAFVRPVQIHESDMSDPTTASLHMRRIQAAVNETTQATRSHPEQGSITFYKVACGTGGAKVQLPHNLGHNAQFIVTYWQSRVLPALGTAAGHSLVSDEQEAAATRLTDANNLWLLSYVAGVATIRVF